MRKVVVLGAALAVVLGVSGCSAQPASTGTPSPSESAGQNQSMPTIAPSLIPSAAPTSVTDVDPSAFLQTSGDYVFKVGNGPTWCTISPSFSMAICEQNEISAQYEPIPVPDTCEYSYGYQVQLRDTKPLDGTPSAFFPCSGGAFTDPTGALSLNDGERITVNPFNCYVSGVTARCENTEGSFIVLGPKAWALGEGTKLQ